MQGGREQTCSADRTEQGHLLMSDSSSDSCSSPRVPVQKGSGTVPGQLVAFSIKSTAPDAAAVAARGPTSPVGYEFFSAGGSASLRSSGHDGKPRPRDSSGPGLGLVDALFASKISSGFSDSRSVLLRSQLRTDISSPVSQPEPAAPRDDALAAAPMSLPKDFGIASRPRARSHGAHSRSSKLTTWSRGAESEFARVSCGSSVPLARFAYHNPKPCSRAFSSDLSSAVDSPRSVHGDPDSITRLPASDIEQWEDYTCVITHGSNPKMVHIFGDRILESRSSIRTQDPENEQHEKEISPVCRLKPPSQAPPTCAEDYISSVCHTCNRKVRAGKDMHTHRGDKALNEELEQFKTISSDLPESR